MNPGLQSFLVPKPLIRAIGENWWEFGDCQRGNATAGVSIVEGEERAYPGGGLGCRVKERELTRELVLGFWDSKMVGKGL
ncbi:hypothetical protein Tco_1528054 [Tanacetum coccineum]